jgi:hypothetical protein
MIGTLQNNMNGSKSEMTTYIYIYTKSAWILSVDPVRRRAKPATECALRGHIWGSTHPVLSSMGYHGYQG